MKLRRCESLKGNEKSREGMGCESVSGREKPRGLRLCESVHCQRAPAAIEAVGNKTAKRRDAKENMARAMTETARKKQSQVNPTTVSTSVVPQELSYTNALAKSYVAIVWACCACPLAAVCDIFAAKR